TELSIAEAPIAHVQLSRQSTGGVPDLRPIAEPEQPRAFPSAGMRATGVRDRPRGVPEAPAAIERLIERIVRPVPIPGLEIRALERPARFVKDKALGDTTSKAAETSRRPPPVPTAPPPLDIDTVADKVYRLLQRRDRFERERKGRF